MKEPYEEGVANHLGPESCAGRREASGEALTGGDAGAVLSCEIRIIGVPTWLLSTEGNIAGGAIASPGRTPRSQRPDACVDVLCTEPGRSHRRPMAEGPRAGRGRP